MVISVHHCSRRRIRTLAHQEVELPRVCVYLFCNMMVFMSMKVHALGTSLPIRLCLVSEGETSSFCQAEAFPVWDLKNLSLCYCSKFRNSETQENYVGQSQREHCTNDCCTGWQCFGWDTSWKYFAQPLVCRWLRCGHTTWEGAVAPGSTWMQSSAH